MRSAKEALRHTIPALVPLAMAALQWNDPDPLFWAFAYLMAALAPLGRSIQRHWPGLFNISSGVLFAGLVISLPGSVDFVLSDDYASIVAEMDENRPHIESAREFLGLVIALICHLPYRKWHLRGAK